MKMSSSQWKKKLSLLVSSLLRFRSDNRRAHSFYFVKVGKYIGKDISAISRETRNGEMGRGSKLNTGKILIKLAKKGQFRVKVITRVEPENENTLQTLKT